MYGKLRISRHLKPASVKFSISQKRVCVDLLYKTVPV